MKDTVCKIVIGPKSSEVTHEVDCSECQKITNALESIAMDTSNHVVGDDGSLCNMIRKHAGMECSLDFLEHNPHLIPECAMDKKILFSGSCARTGCKPCYRLFEKNDAGEMTWRIWLGEDDDRV